MLTEINWAGSALRARWLKRLGELEFLDPLAEDGESAAPRL